MNKLIEFASENRTTDFFRDYAIIQIEVAYRIMEYMRPEDNFLPKDLDDEVQYMIDRGFFTDAFEGIYEELGIDVGCSRYYEDLKRDAIELMKNLW